MTDQEKVRYGEEQVLRGGGGETHQVAGAGVPAMTTNQGVVVGDDQNTLRVGDRGPAALEDFHFREKLFHFDHERIPPPPHSASSPTARPPSRAARSGCS